VVRVSFVRAGGDRAQTVISDVEYLRCADISSSGDDERTN